MHTVGVSPKVKLPAWALTTAGVVLAVIGFVLGGDDGGTVRDIGLALSGGGPLGAIIGYHADPGVVTDPPAQDEIAASGG
jgi:hypothetical protein